MTIPVPSRYTNMNATRADLRPRVAIKASRCRTTRLHGVRERRSNTVRTIAGTIAGHSFERHDFRLWILKDVEISPELAISV